MSFLIWEVFLQRLWFSKETSSLDVCLMPKEKSWEWTHKVLTFHLVLVIDQSILPSHKHDMLNMLKRLHMHLVTWAKKKNKQKDLTLIFLLHMSPINSGTTSFKNTWDKIMKQNTGISKTNTYNYCRLYNIIILYKIIIVKMWKVWTQELFHKYVEYDNPGEHSPE